MVKNNGVTLYRYHNMNSSSGVWKKWSLILRTPESGLFTFLLWTVLLLGVGGSVTYYFMGLDA